jgi:hypothetical protein
MVTNRKAQDEATARSARLGQLSAQAGQHEIAGAHSKAAAAHYERGELHEAAGNRGTAMDCYKSAADSLAKHLRILGQADDCYWLNGGKGK